MRVHSLLTLFFSGNHSYVIIHSFDFKCLNSDGSLITALPAPTTSLPTGCTQPNPLPGIAQCDSMTGVWKVDVSSNTTNMPLQIPNTLNVTSVTLEVNGSIALGGGLSANIDTVVDVRGECMRG